MSNSTEGVTRRGLALRLSFTPRYGEVLEKLRVRAGKATYEELLCEMLRLLARDHGFNVPDESVSPMPLQTEAKTRRKRIQVQIVLVYNLDESEDHHWPQRLMTKLECDEEEVINKAVEAYEKRLARRALH